MALVDTRTANHGIRRTTFAEKDPMGTDDAATFLDSGTWILHVQRQSQSQ